MQSSFYKLLVVLTASGNKQGDAQHPEETGPVEEIIYENQKRSSMFSNYSTMDMDYPLWTDKSGNKTHCKEDQSLPSNEWYWTTPWTLAASKINRDAEGWQYATGWNSTTWKNQSRAIHFVRRRIWKRTRAIKPPGYEEPQVNQEELDEILDEFEVIASTRKPKEIYISPDYESDLAQMNEKEEKEEKEELPDSEDLSNLSLGESTEEIVVDLDVSSGITIDFRTEDDEEEKLESPSHCKNEQVDNEDDNDEEAEDDESHQFTLEDVIKANQQAELEEKFEKELHNEEKSQLMESEVIREQERKDKERREREELEFQRLEKERQERVVQLQQQRDEERKQMEESWRLKEEQVRQQLEADQKRLQLLQGEPHVDTEDFTEVDLQQHTIEHPIPASGNSTVANAFYSSLVFDDEEDDEIFEIVTDSDDE